jgi:hypothetical protein
MNMSERNFQMVSYDLRSELKLMGLTRFHRELLQPNDDVIRRSFAPGIFWDQCSSNLLELAVVEYALRTALNVDSIASIYEGFRSCRCEGGSMFESLAH